MTNPPLIVGVGASAGGLEAFQRLLTAIGDAPNMAIVFVQHLDPTSKSLLADLLAKSTAMSIVELAGRQKIKSNTVYVCPPQTLLELKNGFVSCVESEDERQAGAIDHFFHSIAESQGDRGIGVILSGSGSDGTLGLKAISDRGGLTFAQSAESAKFDSMPRSAATTGVADHVMSPAEIATELLAYVKHLDGLSTESSTGNLQKQIEDAIPMIADSLMKATNHNFQHYKINTLMRRIQRRMQVLKVGDVAEYVSHLQHNEDEAQALFRELLIGVTAFFRDPDAFDSLRTSVLPKLFENRTHGDTVRIWVAGCANGAEAYTMAILCREVMEELSGVAELVKSFDGDGKDSRSPKVLTTSATKSLPEVQIFATDIDERALRVARNGMYPSGIEDHVSPERLKRFFVKRGKKYQVNKEVRELVLFSEHNLISDPPFSRQDLISCRNLLIYLGLHLQNKLIPLFHYALRPGGHLFLGPSENITSHGELFRAVDAKNRISQRKGTAMGKTPTMSLRQHSVTSLVAGPRQPDTATDLTAIRQRILIDEFSPKSCIVDDSGQVLDAAANLEKYLSINDGAFQNNILKIAASGLRIGLRAAIAEAKKTTRRVTHENLSVRVGNEIQRVMITVQPMPRLGEDKPLFMIVFHDVGLPVNRDDPDSSGSRQDFRDGDEESKLLTSSATSEAIIAQMERELETTRSDLEKTMQDMEAGNEELKSSNEELLSMNEELQSANEELETSKEEIRSGSDAVARANDDLENLLRSTEIATVFLDNELRIRSYTPAIAEIYDLIPTDIGRPLEKFVPSVVDMPPLPDPKTVVAEVVKTFGRDKDVTGDASKLLTSSATTGADVTGDASKLLTSSATKASSQSRGIEHTVRAHSGKSYIRRVLPYRSHTGLSEGIVVTFTDVTELSENEMRFRGTFENAAVGIAHVALDGRWLRVNDRLCGIVGYSREDLIAKTFQEITHPDDLEADIVQLERLITGEIPTYSVEKRYLKSSGELVWVNLTVSLIRDSGGQPEYAIAIIEDITNSKKSEQQLRASEELVRTIAENSTLAMVMMNDRGYVTYCNQVLLDMTDYDAEEIRSAPLHDLVHHHYPDGRPYPMAECPIDRALPEDFSVRAHEDLFFRKDGSTFEVSCAASPIFKDGKSVSTVIEIRDVTQPNAAKRDLADREAHLRRVINNMLSFVGVLDTDGTLLEANQTALTAGGVSRDEVIGKKFWDCPWWNYDPAISEQLQVAFEKTLTGNIVRYDVEIRTAGDSQTMIDFMLVPVRDADGHVTHVIPSGMDISERVAAEKAVVDSAAKLRVLFDQAFFYTGILDLEGRLTEINDAALTAFGFRREDVIGLPFWETPWWRDLPESQRALKENFSQVLAGNSYREELRFFTPDNPDCISDFVYQPAFDDDGNVMFVVCNGSDVTERRHAMDLIRQGEDRLRLAMNAAQLTLWEWDIVKDKISWAKELDDHQAIDRADNIGGLNDFLALVHPKDRKSVRGAINECLSDGKPYHIEFRTRRSDGTYRWVLSMAHLSVNDADAPIRMVGVDMDITERHKIERKASDHSKRLAMALKAGDMAAWEWKPNGSVWTAAVYQMLGIPSDQTASPELFFSCVHPEDIEGLKNAWQNATDGADAYHHEFRIIRPNGEIRWMVGVGEVVRDTQGEVASVYGLNWDSTKEHLIAERLRESERAAVAANASKSAFVANMSHEIRTPMTAIIGYADLIREYVDHPEATEYLQTIRRNGEFLLDIINDILDLSKIEADMLKITSERFAPDKVVEDVRSIMEVRASESNVRLSVNYRGNLPAIINSDSKRLKQILINLVGNAIKFTKQGSVEVTVSYVAEFVKNFDGDEQDSVKTKVLTTSATKDDRMIRFEVSDTGIGISAKQREKLFQPFSQGDASVTREFGGTGLGLVISRRLAQMLGGEITVESELGKGSTFTLAIAVGDLTGIETVDPERISREPDATPNDAEVKLNCRILLVDDRRDVRFLSNRILSKAGATIVEATDGLLAIAEVEKATAAGEQFDLVLLDMQMPNLDGYGTAERLRKMAFDKPIIALTADAMQGDMKRCLECGCNAYLSKPIDVQHLLQMVQRFT